MILNIRSQTNTAIPAHHSLSESSIQRIPSQKSSHIVHNNDKFASKHEVALIHCTEYTRMENNESETSTH